MGEPQAVSILAFVLLQEKGQIRKKTFFRLTVLVKLGENGADGIMRCVFYSTRLLQHEEATKGFCLQIRELEGSSYDYRLPGQIIVQSENKPDIDFWTFNPKKQVNK